MFAPRQVDDARKDGVPMDKPALDALLARTHGARRELAEVVRESRVLRERSRTLREWWERFRTHPSPPLRPPPYNNSAA
jgi:hypothetical protein